MSVISIYILLVEFQSSLIVLIEFNQHVSMSGNKKCITYYLGVFNYRLRNKFRI